MLTDFETTIKQSPISSLNFSNYYLRTNLPSHVPLLTRLLKATERYSFLNKKGWGTWVAQSVGCLTSAQVMISWFMGSSPA